MAAENAVALGWPRLSRAVIGLDARGLTLGAGGIARHLRRVLGEWARVDGSGRIVPLLWPSDEAALPAHFAPDALRRFEPALTDAPIFSLRSQLRLLPILRRARLDAFHSHYCFLPLLMPSLRGVLTIHDVIPLRFPEHYPVLAGYLRRVLPLAARRARVIMTDSEWTKRDVMQFLGVDEAKVCVVPLGVEPKFQLLGQDRDARVDALKRQLGLPDRFVLWLGATRATKNLPILLRAFSLLKQRGLPHALVMTRGDLLEDRGIITVLTKERLLRDVIFINGVPDEEMPTLYNAAEVFVFPSTSEGFGLPPLEAMACGTPVVCSNAASLPEVVGQAALQVPPHDAQALADALWMALNDTNLRHDLRARGLEQARKFNWSETTQRTLEVYERALS